MHNVCMCIIIIIIINGIMSVNRKAKEDCKGITYCQVIRYGGN